MARPRWLLCCLIALACLTTTSAVAVATTAASWVRTAAAPLTVGSHNSFQLTQAAGLNGCWSEDGTSGTCTDGLSIREPAGIVVSPDGKFVYTAIYATGGVDAFSRDTTTGYLTQLGSNNGCIVQTAVTGCTTGKALSQVWDIAISPDGLYVYAAAYGSSALDIFSRNTSTGVLTQLASPNGCIVNSALAGCTTGTALGGADGVTVSPDGSYIYVASYTSNAVAVFKRNGDGTLSQLAGTSGCISNSGGTCATGRGMAGANAIAMSPDGNSVYTTSDTDGAIAAFTRNTGTGVLTEAANTTACISSTGNSGACTTGTNVAGPFDVAVSPDNANVYVAAANSNAVAVFSRTPGSTPLTPLSGTAACVSNGGTGGCASGAALTGVQGVTVSPDGQDVYATGFGADSLVVLRRKSDGSLTQWPATRGCISVTGTSGSCAVGKATNGSHRVTVAPDGRDVYEAGSSSTATGFVTVFARTH